MRRRVGVRRLGTSKPDTCTERRCVDPTGISVKVGVQYPGRSEDVPLCYEDWKILGSVFRSQQRP
jgi:hypothetical protein